MSGTVASSQEQVVASPDSLNCTMDTRTNDLGASRTPRRYIKDGKTPDQSHYMAMDHCNANVDKKRIGDQDLIFLSFFFPVFLYVDIYHGHKHN